MRCVEHFNGDSWFKAYCFLTIYSLVFDTIRGSYWESLLVFF